MDEREFIQSRSVFKKSPVKDTATQWEAPKKEEVKEEKEVNKEEESPAKEECKVEVSKQEEKKKPEKNIWPVQNTRTVTRASVTRKNERSKEEEKPLKFSQTRGNTVWYYKKGAQTVEIP